MSTVKIADQKQWQAGDDVRVEWPDGSVLTSKIEDAAFDKLLLAAAGAICVVHADGRVNDGDGRTITVTRTVEDIPEPTGLGAVVRFEDGVLAVRADDSDLRFWTTSDECFGWDEATTLHGPAVAVLSPGVQDGAR